jgi:hypothetical protein
MPSPKETIVQMRRLIRWLTAVIAVLTVVICLLAGFLLYEMSEQPIPDNIGRNYTTTQS